MNNRNYNIYFHTHTVSGIVISVVLFVIFFAGSFAFFKDEITNWERDESIAINQEVTLNADVILDSINSKYPLHARTITLTHSDNDRKVRVSLEASKDSLASKENKERKYFLLDTPTFKTATYWTNQKHWDWAVNPNAREKASFLKENILPLQESGRLKFIDNVEGVNFTKNIKVRFAYGHTEAMMLPQISYKEKTLVYMADLLPSTGHIPLPYVMSYDMFPMKTLNEKAAFLKEAAENNYILVLEHDPINECCTVQMTEKGIKIDQTFQLNDI